jgi:hypothetical protein
MNKLTFGFFGEDAAQKQFLMAYLDQQYPDLFIETDNYDWKKIKPRNNTDVDKSLKSAAFQAFTKYRLNVLFVGRDTDATDTRKINSLREELAQKCGSYKGAVLMVPVQCVEHWLWYLKWKLDNPGKTKNQPLESQMRDKAKDIVYGENSKSESHPSSRIDLLNHLDVAWLESRSESFRHFHQQVITFLKAQENG